MSGCKPEILPHFSAKMCRSYKTENLYKRHKNSGFEVLPPQPLIFNVMAFISYFNAKAVLH